MTLTPSMPPPADKLDTLLSAHLRATLDPQRGRAAAAFRSRLAQADHPAAPIPMMRAMIPKRALWFWAGTPSLLAACLAVAVTLHFVKPADTGVKPVNSPPAIAAFNQVENARDVDGGIAVLDDNTVVRVIRRQSVSHKEWQDPTDHATYSVTEPVENVGYVQVQPY